MNASAFYDPLTKTFKFCKSTYDLYPSDPMPNLYPSDLNARLDMFEERMKKLEEKISPKEIKIDYFADLFPNEYPKMLERELENLRFKYDQYHAYACKFPESMRGRYEERYLLEWDDYLEFFYDKGENPFSNCDPAVYSLFMEQQKLYKLKKLQLN